MSRVALLLVGAGAAAVVGASGFAILRQIDYQSDAAAASSRRSELARIRAQAAGDRARVAERAHQEREADDDPPSAPAPRLGDPRSFQCGAERCGAGARCCGVHAYPVREAYCAAATATCPRDVGTWCDPATNDGCAPGRRCVVGRTSRTIAALTATCQP